MTVNLTMIARGGHPDFLDLPWGQPLAEWEHPRLVKMAHGISRHVVRFVGYDDRVYALKETGAVAAANWNNLHHDDHTLYNDETGEPVLFDDGRIAPGVTIE